MSVEFIPVAKIADIAPGSATTVVIDGREIAVFHVGGAFYALDNTCPHQGGPLAEGWIEGAAVTCPWHAWCFRLADGKMTLGDFASVDAFDVRVGRRYGQRRAFAEAGLGLMECLGFARRTLGAQSARRNVSGNPARS